jgi:hypothetical protein
MTWHDIYVILSSTLTSDEKSLVGSPGTCQWHPLHWSHSPSGIYACAMWGPTLGLSWPRHATHLELYAHLPPCGATDCFP